MTRTEGGQALILNDLPLWFSFWMKSQLIAWKDEGYWDERMDEAEPTIVVTDWFYSGSGCHYQMCVKLLSADFSVIEEICTGDVFEREVKTERWFKVSHIFDWTPGMGIRHILFQHQGLYTNGKPPGDDGVKITQSRVCIPWTEPSSRLHGVGLFLACSSQEVICQVWEYPDV